MPCNSCEPEEKERSQVVREVTDMIDTVCRRIRQIEGKDAQETALLSLFKYLGSVTDLVECGTKLSAMKMKIAQKQDEAETKEESSEAAAIASAIGEIYAD